MAAEAGAGKAEVFLEASGILRIVHPRGAELDVEGIRRIQKLHENLAGERKLPVLVDARHIASMSAEARRAGAGPEIARITSRLAILIESPLSAVIGNFFMRVSRPMYPTRLFNDPVEAEAWLKSAE